MGSAATIGLVMGGLNAVSSLSQASHQHANSQAQADAARAQAKMYQQQARQAEDVGRAEAQAQEEQKSKLRRQYQDTMSRNKSLLAAGNVDSSSGSALQTAEGNIEQFAQDMGDNAYSVAMKEWETRENSKRLKASAQTQKDMASAYQSQANNWFPSLLNTAISGASGFASGYSMAGGSLKNLWSSKK